MPNSRRSNKRSKLRKSKKSKKSRKRGLQTGGAAVEVNGVGDNQRLAAASAVEVNGVGDNQRLAAASAAAAEPNPEIGIIGIGVSEKIGTLLRITHGEANKITHVQRKDDPDKAFISIYDDDDDGTKKFTLLNIIFKKAYFKGSSNNIVVEEEAAAKAEAAKVAAAAAVEAAKVAVDTGALAAAKVEAAKAAKVATDAEALASEPYVEYKQTYRNLQELIVSFFLLKHLKNIMSITYDGIETDIEDEINTYVIRDLLTDKTNSYPEYFPGFRKLTNYSRLFEVDSDENMIDTTVEVTVAPMRELCKKIMDFILTYSVGTNKRLISFIGVGAGYLTSLLGKSGASNIFYGSITPYKTEYGDYIAKKEYEDYDDDDKYYFVYTCMMYRGLGDDASKEMLQENMVKSLKVATCPLRSSLYARAAARNAEITLKSTP
jgi:hypothetical protein